jgi:hypothetical protein
LLLHFRAVGLRITQVDAFTDTPFAGNPILRGELL